MGQYYRPTILRKNWKTSKNPVECSLSPYDFDNGAKLMEHSYAGNNYVGAICHLLATTYYGYPFVWVGDYADHKLTTAYPESKKDEWGWEQGGVYIYGSASTMAKADNMKGLSTNLHAVGATEKQYAYAINFTKKEYVKIPKYKKGECRVHPLPLLTCDGNGRGGGDYRLCTETYDYSEDKRIGSWAYDKIGVTNSKSEIEGMTEIDGYFEIDF